MPTSAFRAGYDQGTEPGVHAPLGGGQCGGIPSGDGHRRRPGVYSRRSRRWVRRWNLRLLDEATDELDAEDDAGLTFGSRLKARVQGQVLHGRNGPTGYRRGGTPLAFGCSCNGCKAPDNKSCTDECVKSAWLAGNRPMDVEQESFLGNLFKELSAEHANMRETWTNERATATSAMRKPMPSRGLGAARAQVQARATSPPFDTTMTQGVRIQLGTKSRHGLRRSSSMPWSNGRNDSAHGSESELTRRMVCCSDIECLERMGMRSPGWHTRFQCCQHARAILAERKLIPETQTTLYTLCNGSKRHGQKEGLLENVKALRHFTKYLKRGEGDGYQLSNAEVDALVAYLNVYAQWTQEQEKKCATVALKRRFGAHTQLSPSQDMGQRPRPRELLASVVSPWIKDTQSEYMDTPEGRDAHATTMQKMLDSAHPVAFDMTFIAMKLQQIDDIGVHGYNLEGTPTHPQKWWYDRKQDGTYNPNPDGSLTAGKTKRNPAPPATAFHVGSVIMTFDKYVEDQS